MKNMIHLIDILIDEARQDNDTALADQVLRNQGAINYLRRLKDYCTNDLSSIARRHE